MSDTEVSSRYSVSVKEYPIDPPIGDEYGFGAKGVVYDRQQGRVCETLHEHWGRTSREAYQKAKQEADEWLAANNHDSKPDE